jgi:hypothetical protein
MQLSQSDVEALVNAFEDNTFTESEKGHIYDIVQAAGNSKEII